MSFPESKLEIRHWLNKGKDVIVACTRCDNAVEISAELLLEGLQCPNCDGRIEDMVGGKKEEAPLKVTLIPALITLKGGGQIIAYIPVVEGQ
jgi:DNA-directed RNA polymerase subunit RPC12/RpoP